jgi:methylglyoxal synthase
MEKIKRIALVAHDNIKKELIEWVEWNWEILSRHKLVCTGTTGRLVEDVLKAQVSKAGGDSTHIQIHRLLSGPLGGDQQLGSMIAEGKIDLVIFFWDPMMAQPHEMDVKALLRITVLYNIPTASNRSTADFLISSPLFKDKYQPKITNFNDYINRKVF